MKRVILTECGPFWVLSHGEEIIAIYEPEKKTVHMDTNKMEYKDTIETIIFQHYITKQEENN